MEYWTEGNRTFAYWDEEVRPKIAAVRGGDVKDIKVDALGDLRIIRNSIIHNRGIISASDYARLKKLNTEVQPGVRIALSRDGMHKIFIAVKQSIAEIINTYVGHLPGAPDPSQVVGIAIQNADPRQSEED